MEPFWGQDFPHWQRVTSGRARRPFPSLRWGDPTAQRGESTAQRDKSPAPRIGDECGRGPQECPAQQDGVRLP
jgi:hypothetical protein